jgi:hypothetical protein
VAAGTASAIRSIWPVGGIWPAAVAAAGGVAVATLLILWSRLRNRRLELFADGSFRYAEPDRTVIARWDQIALVYGTTSKPRRFLGRHEYRVLAGDVWLRLGTEVGADAELGVEIDLRTRPNVVARTDTLLSGGVPVDFGPITLTPDGLQVRSIGKHSIPYHRLRSHHLGRRHYLFRSFDEKRTLAVPVTRIPSPAALHEVLEERVARARRATAAA